MTLYCTETKTYYGTSNSCASATWTAKVATVLNICTASAANASTQVTACTASAGATTSTYTTKDCTGNATTATAAGKTACT